MFRTSSMALASALCMTAAQVALAQQAPTAPAKSKAQAPSIVVPVSPAPKPSAKTLGKGAPSGKLLTREELRGCLKRMDDITATNKELLQRRAALDGEKDGITKSGEALKAQRSEVEAKLAMVREWEGRTRAYAAEIEAFNQRGKSLEELPRGQRAELAKALEVDRERLTAVRANLNEEEARLVPTYEASVRSYNERVLARDAQVNEWNARNKAINDDGSKLEGARNAWLGECANRPYRDEDEIAIKAGK